MESTKSNSIHNLITHRQPRSSSPAVLAARARCSSNRRPQVVVAFQQTKDGCGITAALAGRALNQSSHSVVNLRGRCGKSNNEKEEKTGLV